MTVLTAGECFRTYHKLQASLHRTKTRAESILLLFVESGAIFAAVQVHISQYFRRCLLMVTGTAFPLLLFFQAVDIVVQSLDVHAVQVSPINAASLMLDITYIYAAVRLIKPHSKKKTSY